MALLWSCYKSWALLPRLRGPQSSTMSELRMASQPEPCLLAATVHQIAKGDGSKLDP